MKPRVPFYLRVKDNSRVLDLSDRQTSFLGQYIPTKFVYTYMGNFVQCKTCEKIFRERDLKVRFVREQIRGYEICPYCSSFRLFFFPDLTPAQEALLDG